MANAASVVVSFVPVLILATLSSCTSPQPPPPSPAPATNIPATQTQSEKPTCDCSFFPPKEGCDSQCGITTGVIESVHGNSVVIQVPSITSDASGKEATAMKERIFSISSTQAQQLQAIKPGSHIALTFQKDINAVQSIRSVPADPVETKR